MKRFDIVCIETLNLPGMVKNHSLSRRLRDVGIGIAIRMLKEKAERYDKRIVQVDRFFPSTKTCRACGFIYDEMPLTARQWQCVSCGTQHDRDVNAARNILAVGQTAIAHGDGVRAD